MTVPSFRRDDAWAGVRVLVVGFNADGQSAADNLLHLGASVTILDPFATEETREFSDLLGVLGADVRREVSEGDFDLIVIGDPSVAVPASEAPRLSSLDLARQFEPDQAWLLVGGSAPDDARAVAIVERAVVMLRAGGVNAAAATERTAMELVMEPERYDALVVLVTPEQLSSSGSLRPHSACVIEAVDGLGAAFTDVASACIYRPEEKATEDMVADAEVIEGARAIGVTVGTPGLSMLGLVEDVLCDRAFVENRQTSAAEICTLADLPDDVDLEALLASVALARAYGVAMPAIRAAISETF